MVKLCLVAPGVGVHVLKVDSDAGEALSEKVVAPLSGRVDTLPSSMPVDARGMAMLFCNPATAMQHPSSPGCGV